MSRYDDRNLCPISVGAGIIIGATIMAILFVIFGVK